MIHTAVQSDLPGFLSGWVGLVIAILGLLALVASAAAYFRASYAKATVATLGESNAALKEQLQIVKDERAADTQAREVERQAWEAEQEKAKARLDALERENATLREVVQGKADVERLVMLIQDHHHEVLEDRRAFHAEWRGEVDKMLATLDDLLSAHGEQVTNLAEVKTGLGQVKGMLARRAGPSAQGATT